MLQQYKKDHIGVREWARVMTSTLLRVGVGVIMVTHGWLKLTDIAATQRSFADIGIPVPAISAYLAVAGELLGGLGLIVGLLTPIASFGVLATMVVAIGFVHLRHGLLAHNGGFEYPLTLALVALHFIARGAGPISLDAWLAHRHALGGTRRWGILGQNPLQVGS
jgi:putative oxidoreductase